MRPYIGICISIFLVGAMPGLSFAQEEIVFSGFPNSKVESNSEESNRVKISRDDAIEYRVLIKKINGKYYWASRENKELIHIRSGAFYWFISPASGYIKIVDRRVMLDDENPRFLYMEHLTLFLSAITYWGAGENFTP